MNIRDLYNGQMVKLQLTNSAIVKSPWIAASATLALNSGECVLLFRLIASLQSILLILEEALIVVQ